MAHGSRLGSILHGLLVGPATSYSSSHLAYDSVLPARHSWLHTCMHSAAMCLAELTLLNLRLYVTCQPHSRDIAMCRECLEVHES
jgi:hypothetical protein